MSGGLQGFGISRGFQGLLASIPAWHAVAALRKHKGLLMFRI